MIKVKELKKLIENLPDDAKCYAYEGERRGIGIWNNGDSVFDANKTWWIDAGECSNEETYTEGFETNG